MKIIITYLISFLIFISCSLFSKKQDGMQTEKRGNQTDSQVQEHKTVTEKQQGGATDETSKPVTKDDKVKILNFDRNSIPKDCEYKGNIIDGARWTDKNGENILIVSNTPVKPLKKESEEREQRMYAYNYISDGSNGYKLLWKIEDFSDSYCDVDAKTIPGTIEILDIDGDGIAESLFIYELEGRCDVSPLDIKLMMHSGSTKLVIRGTTIVHPGAGETYGGTKNFDAAFNSSPKEFKTYASKKWDNFINSKKDN